MLWIVLIIGSIAFYVWLSNHKDDMKDKAARDTQQEFSAEISETKQLLNKSQFFSKFKEDEDEDDYWVRDKTIGHCPKCGIGYLEVRKRFTGMDYTYGRYPTYDKYLACSSSGCNYTEKYDLNKVRRKRQSTKLSVAEKFKKDFEEAYKI